MSKIAVELARSVEEQQTLSRTYKIGASSNQKSMLRSDSEHHADEDSIDTAAPDAKRRRLSTSNDKGSDKLQEFLRVMQPPSKFRDWDGQNLLADGHGLVVSAEPDEPTGSMVDGNSNEEIKRSALIPKNVGERDSPSEKHAWQERVPPARTDDDEDQTLESEKVRNEEPQLGLSVAPATSDENWLRSRTSRSLGLAGNNDDETIKPQSQSQGTLNATKDNSEEMIRNPMVGLVTEGEIEKEQESGHSGQAPLERETHDVGSGRLFLRNLTYTCTENDIRDHFESNRYDGVEEVIEILTVPLLFRSKVV